LILAVVVFNPGDLYYLGYIYIKNNNNSNNHDNFMVLSS